MPSVDPHQHVKYVRLETGGAEAQRLSKSMGFLPPKAQAFDVMFFRQVFHRAEVCGYVDATRKAIHANAFRDFLKRMSVLLGGHLTDGGDGCIYSDTEILGQHTQLEWLTWNDLRVVFEEGDSSPVHVDLHCAERTTMVFEGVQNSWLGGIWAVFMLVMIVLSIANIMGFAKGDGFGLAIIGFFTFDYFVKLFCAPFCRHGIFHPEWLIQHMVPDATQGPGVTTEYSTVGGRVWSFVSRPLNLVDLVSILPSLCQFAVQNTPIKLGFLRVLRLLRLFRIVQFGKFSAQIRILGEVLLRSTQAIFAMGLYIGIVSIIIGSVLQQWEQDESWSFGTPAAAIWWVSGRLCNMHGSVNEKSEVPVEHVSWLLVVLIGIIKGAILIIPVGQITKAFKEVDTDFKAHEKLKEQLDRETVLPLGTEWSKDPHAPTVELSIYEPGVEEGVAVASGHFNVPLFEKQPREAVLNVPLRSESLQGLFARVHPSLDVKVEWKPITAPSPRGKLTLRPLQGRHFSRGTQWRCGLQVPVRLHGAMGKQVTRSSTGGPPEPRWSDALLFDVEWEEAAAAEEAAETVESQQRRVLQMLVERSACLRRIEAFS